MTLQDLAWHRAVGQLIERLDQPGFWLALSRLLQDYVPADSWVVLLFDQGRPRVFAESVYEGGGSDPLYGDYLQGLYLLDPFYIASREHPGSGLVRLADVAPECFEQTDYYRLYFTHNVVADEVQFNAQLDGERTLCLSLGSKCRFTPEQIAVLELIRPWVIALMRQRMAFEPPAETQTAEGGLEAAMQHLGAGLTSREVDVVRLMLAGCSNKEVARKLDISAETVKVHRRHLYAKLAIKSQSELFALFIRTQAPRLAGASASLKDDDSRSGS
ncbi:MULTISPECIES: helix-turn-helix transcriptional regulator [unclassified Pseudomonas]|uniref:response regulator transcription factor n=1 Tax=unclassified Pseudomonas TaxID=196821 RepID=UPI00244B7062|nr:MULTISPECIES: helix-turn-helix transcriptional regulator [unclassified Pseudomonas]MDG9927558.1 helix-turn-helix transcriptional regulator [Pseudomonas sp. GD04042]MDH0485307.1 helix-turn-helix transcriptional regulator [Pseudomonas sp. GD04015]MDH0603789.1 helix-turn-helix transcriptional regulator [Pseudomonas sp. GD03869]